MSTLKNIGRPRVDDKKVVEGFVVKNNKIICESDSVIIANESIDVLNLSTRSYRALCRIGMLNLADLVDQSFEKLITVQNLGCKSVCEICDKLKDYLDCVHPINKEFSEHIKSDAPLVITSIDCISNHIPIESLNLSKRPYNCLKNNGIDYIMQVSGFSFNDLMKICNMGSKSAEEILKAVSQFQKCGMNSIHTKRKFIRISDGPIKLLKLSDEDYSILYSNEITTIGQIINYSLNQLVNFFENEQFSKRLFNAIHQYKEECVKTGNAEETDGNNYCISKEQKEKATDIIILAKKKLAFLNSAKLEKYLNRLLNQIEDNAAVVLQVQDIREVMNSHQVISEYEEYLCRILERNQYNGIDCIEFRNLLPDYVDERIKERVEKELLNSKIIKLDGEKYFMNYPSFCDFLDESNEYLYAIMSKRIAGKTLEEIAHESGGVTRERIRQRESKCMEKVLKAIHISGGIVQEDIYKYMYTTYDLNSDFLKDYLHLSSSSIYYLNYMYKGSNRDKIKKPPIEALDDTEIPTAIRFKIESYVYKNYVKIENQYIPAKRGYIEDALLPVFAKDDISFDDFIDFTNEYLNDLGMSNFVLSKDSYKGRYNKILQSDKVLTKHNQMMRYYDISSRNYDELYNTLNLNQFSDVEISARKLFDENSDLMRDYDIHDEYELHNLLKKTICKEDYPNINLKRTPMIKFGNANREEQVKDLLVEIAPIDVNDFAKVYFEKYGVNPITFAANYAKYINQYNNQGVYEITVPPLNEGELGHMKSMLKDDFYLTSKIKNMFMREYPNENPNKINHFSLRQLGFIVYSDYVISNRFNNASDYYDYLLTSGDIIDISKYKYGIIQTNSFCSKIRKYKESYELIEFFKYKYINIKRITEITGFTKRDIYDFCKNVLSFVGNRFFTIASIRSEGFSDKLDALGFGDYFFTSLLQENTQNFNCFRIGNNKIFRAGTADLNFSDFIEWLLYQTESLSMNIYDACELISEKYNVNVEKYEIKNSITGTSMYYNESTEKIYADYEVYFDEI